VSTNANDRGDALLEDREEALECERVDEAAVAELRPENIRALRLGHGANCSSVGSVIDTLFLGAAVGGAIFAAVCAAMRDEPVRVVGAEGLIDDDTKPAEGEEPAS
jgi:hypothetical protein